MVPLYFCKCLAAWPMFCFLSVSMSNSYTDFEHAVQRLLEPRGRLGRIHQRLEHLGQLADRAHADFVPVEIVLLERLEHLLGRLRAANPPSRQANSKCSNSERSFGGGTGL